MLLQLMALCRHLGFSCKVLCSCVQDIPQNPQTIQPQPPNLKPQTPLNRKELKPKPHRAETPRFFFGLAIGFRASGCYGFMGLGFKWVRVYRVWGLGFRL